MEVVCKHEVFQSLFAVALRHAAGDVDAGGHMQVSGKLLPSKN